MSVLRIAVRYAKSLLELASEQNKLEAVHTDVLTLQGAVKNRDLYLLLKSPIIQPDKKNAALKAVFGGKLDILTMSYMELLVNKGREAYLPEIASEFLDQYRLLKKITSVRITTAEAIAPSVLSAIQSKIIASGVATANLEVETKVNPDLIGGFLLEFDNKRYDASILQKLADLKDDFSKNLYVKEF
jgi:F-type H+-transporting ATPase subunit delta